MRTWDELRRPGTAAGKLEKSHFVGGRRMRNETIVSALDGHRQALLAVVVQQQRHAYRRMLRNKSVKKIIIGKQRMCAVGNQ